MPGQILPDTESRDLTRSSRDFVEIIPASIARPSKAELEELNGQLRELTGRDPRPGQTLAVYLLSDVIVSIEVIPNNLSIPVL